jgi:hypothetical protein
MRQIQAIAALAALGISLGACSSVKDAMGISKNPPNEKQVTTNQPLAMPPDIALRPPQQRSIQAAVNPQPQPVDNSRAQPIQAWKKPPPQPVDNSRAQPIQAWKKPPPQPVDNSRAQPIQAWKKPPPQPIVQQPAANPQVATYNPPRQAAAPIPLGQQAPQYPQTAQAPQTRQRRDPSKMTPQEYNAYLEELRRQELAKKRAKNPNYGTWKNIWSSIWD